MGKQLSGATCWLTAPPTECDAWATRPEEPAAYVPPPEAGDLEAPDEYEILGELARGGMGVVYRARHKDLHRTVALKRILTGRFSTPSEVQRFLLEAESAANLDHPNIVPIYEIGQRKGQPFFTMKLIEGGSLTRHLRELSAQPRSAALMMAKVARAVQFAHSRGILHRDLKPANILIDGSGEPYVTDFGLAKRLDGGAGLTQTGSVVGTPAYMPPEQAAGRVRELSTACDLYSLGAILYEILTGRPPFAGESATDVLLQVLESEPVRPRQLNPALDRDLEAICLRCLQKDPAHRYSSAEALAVDLEAYARGEPVVAAASSASHQLARRLLRETRHTELMELWGRVWVGLAATILAFSLITNAMLWWEVQDQWLYALLWAVGVVSMGILVWFSRIRRGPPFSDLEWKIAEVWGLFMALRAVTAVVRISQGLPMLGILPMFIMECGMAFGCMAVLLGGTFYVMTITCMVLGIVLAFVPAIGPIVFGPIFAAGLLVPGLRYSRSSKGAREPASWVR